MNAHGNCATCGGSGVRLCDCRVTGRVTDLRAELAVHVDAFDTQRRLAATELLRRFEILAGDLRRLAGERRSS